MQNPINYHDPTSFHNDGAFMQKQKLFNFLWLYLVITILMIGMLNFIQPKRVMAASQIFSVTNTSDSGSGSLRQAVADANNNGNPDDQDSIVFSIPGIGDQTISLLSPLVITQRVIVDGFTQSDSQSGSQSWPGSINAVIRIQIDNSGGGMLSVEGDDIALQGLAIYGSHRQDVIVKHSKNFSLTGSNIGMDSSGFRGRSYFISSTEHNDWSHIELIGTNNARIGGSNPAERNIMGYCASSCVKLSGDTTSDTVNTYILGNNFGVGADNITNISRTTLGFNPSAVSVFIDSGTKQTHIGGLNGGDRNVFSHTVGNHIYARDSTDLTIQGNLLSMAFYYSESASSILLEGVSGALIGGDSPEASNTIVGRPTQLEMAMHPIRGLTITDSASGTSSHDIIVKGNRFGVLDDQTTLFENGSGIVVEGHSSDVLITHNTIRDVSDKRGVVVDGYARQVAILSNSISGHSDSLGIDIGDQFAADQSDSLDTDSGPNDNLNAPGYTKIVEGASSTDITFTADWPAGDYLTEFFTNDQPATATNPGEGQYLIGSAIVNSTGNGLQEYSATVTGRGHSNITLTGTEYNKPTFSGYGSTSEFGSFGEPSKSDLQIIQSINKEPSSPYIEGMQYNLHVEIKNNGPQSLQIKHGGDLLADSLGVHVLSPGIEFNHGGNSGEIECNNIGQVKDIMAYSSADQDSRVIKCELNSSSSTKLLGSGESLSYDILFSSIKNSQQPTLNIFSTSYVPPTDPDFALIKDTVNSNSDWLNSIITTPTNNSNTIISDNIPERNLSASVRGTNSSDLIAGKTYYFDITVSNHGSLPLDISGFKGLDGAKDSLATLFLNPKLEFVNLIESPFTKSNGLLCRAGNNVEQSNIKDVFPNHLNFKQVHCYHGSSSAPIIAPGDKLTLRLRIKVISGIKSNEEVATIGVPVMHDDPDFPKVVSAISQGIDPISYSLDPNNGTIDNFNTLFSDSTDFSITTRTAADVAYVNRFGSPDLFHTYFLKPRYTFNVNFKNIGPGDIDLAPYRGKSTNEVSNSLFITLFPPQVTSVHSGTAYMSCTWRGPGSAATLGPAFSAYASYSALLCRYNGQLTSIVSGRAVLASVVYSADNYQGDLKAYTLTNIIPKDPDTMTMYRAFMTSDDPIEYLLSNRVNNVYESKISIYSSQ